MLNKNFDSTFETSASIVQQTIDTGIYTIELQKKGKVIGAPKEFLSTGEATTITNHQSGSTVFDQIKASELEINTWNLKNFDSLDLFGKSKNKEVKGVVKNGSDEVVWQGWFVQNQWSEPFIGVPYKTQLRFIDGLGTLKDIEFTDPLNGYYRGKEQLSALIAYLLSETGIKRNFVDQINIIDAGTDPVDIRGTMFEKWIDIEAFRGMNCYDVLQNILKSYNARIEYYNDKYYIRRWNDFQTSCKSVEYEIMSSGAAIVDNYTTTNRVKTITCPTHDRSSNFSFVLRDQELRIIPGYKELTINHEYGKKESIFPRSLFDEDDFTGTGGLKYYSTSGIEKFTGEENTFAKYIVNDIGRFGEGTPQPQFIQGLTETNYDPSGMTDDLFEEFIVEINMLSPEKQTFQVNPGRQQYIGHRNSIGGNPKFEPAYSRGGELQRKKITTKVQYGRLFIDMDDLPEIIIDEGSSAGTSPSFNPPFFVVFTNEDNVPIGLKPGVFYSLDLWGFYFDVYENLNQLNRIVLDPSEQNKEFECEVFFAYTLVQFGTTGTGLFSRKLSIRGNWINYGYLLADIDQRNISQKRPFSTTFDSIARYTTIEDKLEMYIEKPSNNVATNRSENGAWLIESFRVQFKETPEKDTETIALNPDNTEKYELDIMFAEVPIYTNFKNAVLRYFNVFYSRSLTNAPGLQYYDNVEGPGTEKTLYSTIKDSYVNQIKSNRYQISGTIQCPDLVIFDKIIKETYTNKLYLPLYEQFNLFTGYRTIEMQEIGNADSVDIGDFSDDYSNDLEI